MNLGHIQTVALLAEGVDRNCFPSSRPSSAFLMVALLAEGVDRNSTQILSPQLKTVALLAEGVDRNCVVVTVVPTIQRRPPRGGRG